VERRVKNLDFVFNYMYSNWMSTTSYLNSGSYQDAHLWKGLDGADRRNYLDANMVYPLPHIHSNRVLNTMANGWLVDNTVIWGTGGPLNLPSADFNWGAPGCTSYAPVGGQTRAHWLNNNQSCWKDRSTWEPQTTPTSVGFIRGPETLIWNASFHKQFALKREGMFVQFRMEAWNAPNHPTWGAAGTNNDNKPVYSPTTSWTGFGTLPTSQANVPRTVIASLKILF
jgi:hypothetical protein